MEGAPPIGVLGRRLEEEGARLRGVPPSTQAAEPHPCDRAHHRRRRSRGPQRAGRQRRAEREAEQGRGQGQGRQALRRGGAGHREVQRGQGEAGQAREGDRHLQDKVARGQEELNDLRDGLGSMASAQYRTGGIDPSVQLFLSADPDDYLDKASTMDQLSDQQVEALKKVQEKQRSLAQQRQEASEQAQGPRRHPHGARPRRRRRSRPSSPRRSKLLNTLTAAEQAALTTRRTTRASRAAGGPHRRSATRCPPPSRGAAALAAAQTQIGKPYVSGGTGPNSYDCSGLTQWAYAQAGVSIPRTTYTQARTTARGSTAERAPARRPGLLLQRPAPRRPVRGQRPGRCTPRSRAPSSATSR